MGYLVPAEYVAYGLTAETADDWVTMASALMEGHCRRPSLLTTQYVERVRLTSGAQTMLLSYLPVVGVLSGVRVRYGMPRRGEGSQPVLTQIATAFSIPGSWIVMDPAKVDLNAATGELTFPLNLFGLSYNEVEVTYNAGLVTIPTGVKVACAQIVKNAQATPAMNVRSSRIDTMQMHYFAGSLVDDQVKTLLRPYVAQKAG